MAWLMENGQKPKRIVANSSGNHAQAVAYAGQQFGIPTTIFMPEYSSQVKIQATKGYGAEVVLSKTRDITRTIHRRTGWAERIGQRIIVVADQCRTVRKAGGSGDCYCRS